MVATRPLSVPLPRVSPRFPRAPRLWRLAADVASDRGAGRYPSLHERQMEAPARNCDLGWVRWHCGHVLVAGVGAPHPHRPQLRQRGSPHLSHALVP